MASFAKRLRTVKGSMTFYFNGMRVDGALRFHISVMSPDHQSHHAFMIFFSSRWQFMPQNNLPDWFKSLEAEFGRIIELCMATGFDC